MEREHRYSDKEHREVKHIVESEEERGYSPEEAERIGYATVNKRHAQQSEEITDQSILERETSQNESHLGTA